MKRFGEFWTCPRCGKEAVEDAWEVEDDIGYCPNCFVETDITKARIKKRKEPRARWTNESIEDSDEER